MGKLNELRHAVWNVFNKADTEYSREQPYLGGFGMSTSIRPDRPRLNLFNEKTIISGLYTRIAIDVSTTKIRHARIDENEQFLETIMSGLNECLSLEANIDQEARMFMMDIVLTMFDRGVVAVVPIDTTLNPNVTGGFDIKTMRVGHITAWYPKHVKVNVWNEDLGRRQEVTVSKRIVAIIENPLYSVMNEPNSTLQRLIRKLSILDAIDEQSGSGKLDLIIQLPYVIKSEARKQQAETRRKDIEFQLQGSKYGVAYTDGTEKITQLNRPAENNMMKQIEYLTNMLYGQLGLTEEVFNGSADEKTMLNYHNRTIEPIVSAITGAFKRSFLTKTARTQGQSIVFFKDPFKLVPVSQLAEIADKFTRNEILSSNEVRGIIGFKPRPEANADELRNKNLPLPPPDPNAPIGQTPQDDIGELFQVPDPNQLAINQ